MYAPGAVAVGSACAELSRRPKRDVNATKAMERDLFIAHIFPIE
jgi:hypothetical protein